jgi:hypothetical protein
MEKLLEASIDFIDGTTFLQKLLTHSNSIFSILECKISPLFKIYLPLIFYNNLGKLSYPED